MIDEKKVQELRNRSYEFLVMAYWLSMDDWNGELTFKQVLDELSWDYEVLPRLEKYLRAEGYIKSYTAGGVEAGFNVTHQGIVEVERVVLNGSAKVILTDDEKENEKRDLKDIIKTRHAWRSEFLLRLYEASEESEWVTLRSIVEAMHLTEREAYGVEQYLEGAYLIERISGGGLNGSICLTEYGTQQIQEYLLNSIESDEEVQTKQTRGPNANTVSKLKDLRKIRAEKIADGKVNIGWIDACQLAGIDSDTAKKHDPVLRERWYDTSYI